MCEPITAALSSMTTGTMFAASLAVSAVTAGVSYMGQMAQHNAQREYAEDASERAEKNFAMQASDLNTRQLQETAATAVKNQNASLKSRQAAGTAKATSESSGTSIEALLNDYDRQFAQYSDAQMQQLGWTTEQIGSQKENLRAQAEGRQAQFASQVGPKPSLGLALTEFGATAINTYDTFAVRDPLTGKYTL